MSQRLGRAATLIVSWLLAFSVLLGAPVGLSLSLADASLGAGAAASPDGKQSEGRSAERSPGCGERSVGVEDGLLQWLPGLGRQGLLRKVSPTPREAELLSALAGVSLGPWPGFGEGIGSPHVVHASIVGRCVGVHGYRGPPSL